MKNEEWRERGKPNSSFFIFHSSFLKRFHRLIDKLHPHPIPDRFP